MKLSIKSILPVLAVGILISLPVISLADTKPHAGMTVGLPLPAPLTVYSSGYILWNGEKGDLTNAIFQNLKINTSREVIRITQGESHIRILNSDFSLIKPTSGSDLPVAVNIRAGNDILIQDSSAQNFKMVPVPNHYNNGDGFSCEKLATNVQFVRDRSLNNTDGGFDLKCQATLTDLYSEGNYRNYRLWYNETAGTLTSVNPRDSHVWFSGGSTATIQMLNASGSTGKPVFNFDTSNAKPHVAACTFNFSVPTKVFAGSVPKNIAQLFGSSCLPDAKGYAINTVVVATTTPPVVPVTPAPTSPATTTQPTSPVVPIATTTPPTNPGHPTTTPPTPAPSSDTLVHSAVLLPDENHDGVIVISSQATTLGVKKGTVLVATPIADPNGGYLYLVKK